MGRVDSALYHSLPAKLVSNFEREIILSLHLVVKVECSTTYVLLTPRGHPETSSSSVLCSRLINMKMAFDLDTVRLMRFL